VATVVSVMDRPGWGANTDNIVVVDAAERSLTWIPRDLWCPMLAHRINTAFRKGAERGGKDGGHAMLRAMLVEHGYAADESLCLQRVAVVNALNNVSVQVPVETTLRFWYPLQPEHPIEDGRKMVKFDPPSAVLSGERIHQWLGARYDVEGADGSDTSRFPRQQVFVRRLIETQFDFSRLLDDPTLVSMTGAGAVAELREVRADWRFTSLDDVWPAKIEEKSVLVRRPNTDTDASVAHRPAWRRALASFSGSTRRRA
jgi:hypothetical protein